MWTGKRVNMEKIFADHVLIYDRNDLSLSINASVVQLF